MNPNPTVIAHVFTTDTNNSIARLVHLALAAIADENGHVETTVHTLEHMTALPELAIEAALGVNHIHEPMFPAAVELTDGVIVADLLPAGMTALRAGA